MGGRLVTDLPDAGFEGHWQEARQCEPVHAVEAERGSLARAALGGARDVNSIHHQAVADPGRLQVTACSADGVVEALEGPGILGVQWHPERLLATDPRHLAPFRWLLAA
jgi:putative glutamine amidotransferase